MAQIAAHKDAEWQSNRREDKKSTLKSRIKAALKKKTIAGRKVKQRAAAVPRGSLPKKALAKLPAAKPRFVDPMKPRLLDRRRRVAIGVTS